MVIGTGCNFPSQWMKSYNCAIQTVKACETVDSHKCEHWNEMCNCTSYLLALVLTYTGSNFRVRDIEMKSD